MIVALAGLATVRTIAVAAATAARSLRIGGPFQERYGCVPEHSRHHRPDDAGHREATRAGDGVRKRAPGRTPALHVERALSDPRAKMDP
ncbi:hypothetical protein GCM10010305_57970 [Streptomyces termitum]|uniref:Secreted protein n=1 Tax=Streptomyces termitum TaxID=67368 RepID=A0A918WBF7_9ACTN|nr:hypothetical protein GCM10010305_57970 [Streptomyces termitum]